MTLNWETFKSALGSYWNTSSIVYIDEEGSEIPIGSDCEFQEALRVAKLNKNRLKLILYDKNIPSSQKMFMTFPESVRVFAPVKNNDEPSKNTKMYCNSNEKENTCCCGSDAPPEWFTHYMKKFKKDLLHELKSNILEIIDCAAEKEQKPILTKSEPVDFLGEKNETLFSPATTHTKKKKKVSDKDGDFSEQRDLKLSKKLEKLHSAKSERLEKLDNKAKLLLEERKKLLERKRHSKSKLDKNCLGVTEKKNSVKKSASFRENEMYLCVAPGGEFTVTVNIKNDGKIRWSSPRLECFDISGLYLNEMSISLPRLLPNESCFATLRGRVIKALGLHRFKCRVVEDQEKIGTEFTCWARVDFFEPYEKYSHVSVAPKESDAAAIQRGESVEKLIDFEKDVIASSEKKIEENIIEIEKRLQFIDLLRPSTTGEVNIKATSGKTKKASTKHPESQTESCESIQNLEEKEKDWTKRLEQEAVIFGIDCLGLESEASEIKREADRDKKEMLKKLEKIKKDCELESNSDSELSVIFMSEEEENFIVVPLLSKSPSPAESVHEDKKSATVESEDKPNTPQEQPEPAPATEKPVKTREIRIEVQTQVDKETSTPDNQSPTRSRRSPFGEETPKSKPKKMKSKSSEYHFTTANLTQPTFTTIPDGFYSEVPSRFTFTGGKKNSSDRVFEFTFTAEKEEKTQKDDLKGKTVPKTDASGRVIYAVNNMGRCLPVDDIFENGEQSRTPKEENTETDDQGNQNRHEKRNERFNEIPSVNILPNVLMSGASNVASIAFNTAKSVINNLQSAFVTEGKTELGKPACEDKKKVSMENMFRLYEMGFSDLQINRKLLLIHDNDMSKVIEELVRLEENLCKRRE